MLQLERLSWSKQKHSAYGGKKLTSSSHQSETQYAAKTAATGVQGTNKANGIWLAAIGRIGQPGEAIRHSQAKRKPDGSHRSQIFTAPKLHNRAQMPARKPEPLLPPGRKNAATAKGPIATRLMAKFKGQK